MFNQTIHDNCPAVEEHRKKHPRHELLYAFTGGVFFHPQCASCGLWITCGEKLQES